MRYSLRLFIYLVYFLFNSTGFRLAAQKTSAGKPARPSIVIDKNGIVRYSKDGSEARFFGVNYTVPFAYGYRSHKALGIDLKKAIEADVYHLARLGLDAFRVHMWDVEISDTAGNLLRNEHLDLFDYLLYQLKQRHIKILITPIAFWGNGYPQPDEKTPGFSSYYGKDSAVVKEGAIRSQENYIRQIVTHINPYTQLSYRNDPDIIALEINNEPHHSGPKSKVTAYVNRLSAAARSQGWQKPVFYNISESPAYADAVAAASVEGHSFQWYPTGLVAGRTVKGNFLPNVDRYVLPFLDTIPSFRNKARMVYEFDAGDILDPIMYPAMARSFRSAGFQWATQFAYDPMATAYANTEYQTHFLNLAYTPAKAISLLIASRAFHELPSGKSFGRYPEDSVFQTFRVSYRQSISEMNAPDAFYYSGSTATVPVQPAQLQHIAGVGSSPVVRYEGTGAYFLDRLAPGLWRLEVMPDQVFVRDPFGKASPDREVSRLQWNANRMSLELPDLQGPYLIHALDSGNQFQPMPAGHQFLIRPGTYLITTREKEGSLVNTVPGTSILLTEFAAPEAQPAGVELVHFPATVVRAGKALKVAVQVLGVDSNAILSLELRNAANQWRTLSFSRESPLRYTVTIPAEMIVPGILNYRLLLQPSRDSFLVYPGGFSGNPYRWDAWNFQTYQVSVAAPGMPLELFSVAADQNQLNSYNPDWKFNTIEYITTESSSQLVYSARMAKPSPSLRMGWQLFLAEKLQGRSGELPSFRNLVLKARVKGIPGAPLKLALLTKDGFSFSYTVSLSDAFQEISLPLNRFTSDSALLLPRPYPGFQPLYFAAGGSGRLQLSDVDKLEVSFGGIEAVQPYQVEIESVMLKQ